MLSSMSQEDSNLIDAIAESEELALYETRLVRDFIDARWRGFAAKWYQRGFCFHLVFVVTLSLYIRATYMGAMDQVRASWSPSASTRSTQDFWNYVDIFHIFGEGRDWPQECRLQVATYRPRPCDALQAFLLPENRQRSFGHHHDDHSLLPRSSSFPVLLCDPFGILRYGTECSGPRASSRIPAPPRTSRLVVFLFGCLIFLNFIIAAAGPSYQTVRDQIDSLVYN